MIDQCQQPSLPDSAHRAVHNITRHTRTRREMKFTAQIGEFEMDEVVLDLGSEVNVLTKQTLGETSGLLTVCRRKGQ